MNECVTTRGKLVIHTLVLLSPSSIIWYQQKLGHKLVYTTTGVNLAAKKLGGPELRDLGLGHNPTHSQRPRAWKGIGLKVRLLPGLSRVRLEDCQYEKTEFSEMRKWNLTDQQKNFNWPKY